ncbi:het and ankyrin domain protein [Colletotrichum asianum]
MDTNETAEDQWLLFDELTSEYPPAGAGDSDAALTSRLVEHALDQYAQKTSSPRPVTSENNEPLSESVHSPAGKDISCHGRELACPFYKRDPVKYLSCLKYCRLNNPTQLKEHLLQQHRLPPYCPICKKGFQTAKSRDRHIVRRTCSIQDFFQFEGISDDQRRLLFRRHKGLGLQQQWKRICEVIKLETLAAESPYIKDSLGQQVVAFRDYWRKHGQRLIATSLKTLGFNSSLWQNEERRLASYFGIIE